MPALSCAMTGLRFSIASLLFAVAIVGLGLAALNSASPSTALALIVVTVVVLLVAVLESVYRVREAQAFWLGLALFGWFYFAVAFTPALPQVKDFIDRPLIAFRNAIWTVRIPDGDPRLAQRMDTDYDHAAKTTLARPPWHDSFGPTIHCLINLLFALAGGIVGRWFYASNERPTA